MKVYKKAVCFALTIMGACALNTCSGQVNATSLGIGLVPGFPGLTSQVPIILRNNGSAVAAQFDVSYGISHLSPGAIIAGNLGGNTVVFSRQISPGVLRCLVYSPQNAFMRTNAQLGNFPVGVPTGETVGGQMSPSNVIIAGADGSALSPVQATAGGVQVAHLFRSPDGTVSLLFNANTNATYIIQATTNFINWVNLGTNIAAQNFVTLVDADAAKMPSRFYRAVPQLGIGITQVKNGTAGLKITGGYGTTFMIQTSTNLSTWQNLTTNIIGLGALIWSDATAGKSPRKFYRIVQLPPSWGVNGMALHPNGLVNFQILGAQNKSYVVQASTNLTTWQNILTNTMGSGPITFSDSKAGAFRTRFYRVVSLP